MPFKNAFINCGKKSPIKKKDKNRNKSLKKNRNFIVIRIEFFIGL